MNYHHQAPRKVSETLCARNLTEYRPISNELKKRPIVIAIAVHNQAKSIGAALQSALWQTVIKNHQAVVLLLDDNSSDNWMNINSKLLDDPNIAILTGHCGSPARARNALLDYVDANFNSRWICRLDADDTLATQSSVEALCEIGEQSRSLYVLGSNALTSSGVKLSRLNIADPEILLNRKRLVSFIQDFCLYGQEQELPSCNLVLATQSRFRYPNVRSAEDHWLVVELLMFHSEQGVVVPEPLYSIYNLDGKDTQKNQRNNHWNRQRKRLAFAAKCWQQFLDSEKELLGIGQEGVVWRDGDSVFKRFYPWAMDEQHVNRLSALLDNDSPHFLNPTWFFENAAWHCHIPYQPLVSLSQFTSESEVSLFLQQVYLSGVAPLNIKRSNLLLDKNGKLIMIDIGKDIVELNINYFLDICARMYSIGILGLSDEELVRRTSSQTQEEALKTLPRFEDFYCNLILSIEKEFTSGDFQLEHASIAEDITLLIKACSQDAKILKHQVEHIVSQLSYPQKFSRTILLLDTFTGPFLRQYAPSNYTKLTEEAKALQNEGWIDDVLIAPQCSEELCTLYHRWFTQKGVKHSHTTTNAPLSSQIWAFEKVTTRYVLQCDVDVLVGRKDINHDYLTEMITALAPVDILSVGFNIPKEFDGFREYEAELGEYVPEVRMGLLDLERIFHLRPFENPVKDEKFTLTWHRALQRRQQLTRLRSLRGGDSRSFYVHPCNKDKKKFSLTKIRDLIAQGRYPKQQAEKFDLIPGSHWRYDNRKEAIVFLLKGSKTSPELMQRCINSLKLQSDQNFGVILIDDDCDLSISWQWPYRLSSLFPRTTLIRRLHHAGRGVNFSEAIHNICSNPDSLITILDQDDALLGANVVTTLKKQLEYGADLIHLPMFRPDKPLKLYNPDYEAPRSKGGGEVWAHLRAFKKSLYEQIPNAYLYQNGEWITPSDYSTMLAMVELADKPVFVNHHYGYLHQRLPYSSRVKEKQLHRLRYLMALPALG